MQYFFYKQLFFLCGFCLFFYPAVGACALHPKEGCLKTRIAELLQAYPQNELGAKLRSVFSGPSKKLTEFNNSDMPELKSKTAGDEAEPGFWDQMVEHVKKADEFYNKRIKPEGRNNKIRWFRPNIVHFDGFQWALGNTVNYRTNLSDLKTLALYYSYSPLQLKDPFSALKMHSIDFGFAVQEKLSRRWFSRVSGGVRRFVPNQAYRDFYATVGQSFDDESIPYLSLGFGYTIVENLFKMNRSLVWFAGYTMADDVHYPSADPFGYREIRLQGFFHGFSFSYKF